MSIVNEPQYTLPTEELIEAVHTWIKKLSESGGKAWTLEVPVNMQKDPDVLISEVCTRLRDASKQIRSLADLMQQYYPGEIREGSAVENVVRLLTPTEVISDTNAVVPNWAVDTLAKRELKRLAQYLMENHKRSLGKKNIVDTAIDLLKVAYKGI